LHNADAVLATTQQFLCRQQQDRTLSQVPLLATSAQQERWKALAVVEAELEACRGRGGGRAKGGAGNN